MWDCGNWLGSGLTMLNEGFITADECVVYVVSIWNQRALVVWTFYF
jgi:hypothetical protein